MPARREKRRVLVVHNAYQQRGGEDVVVDAETALLRADGHTVLRHSAINGEIGGLSSKAAAAWRATYSTPQRDRLAAAIAAFKPDLVHVHNFFPLLSPAVFDACLETRVPSVLTLHNFRLACAAATFNRNGAVCESCLGRLPWRAVRHGCYRGSVMGSAATARMIASHMTAGTWRHKVDRFLAPSAFVRNKMVQAGLPGARVSVKPNFVADDWIAAPANAKRDGVLFVGRLVPEKGVRTLLDAWSLAPGMPLRIVGDGPLRDVVSQAAATAGSAITVLGSLDAAAVAREMRAAALLVVPSEWFETFGLVVCEAMVSGLPVIAAEIGCLPELVREQETGLLFRPGDARHLHERVRWALAHPAALAGMAARAQAWATRTFNSQAGLNNLLDTYAQVLRDHRLDAARR